MNQYSIKSARGGKFPRDISRRAHLQSQALRSQEWEDLPTIAGLTALRAHAETWAQAKREGKPVASVLPFRSRVVRPYSSDEKGRAA